MLSQSDKKIIEEWCQEAHVTEPVGYYKDFRNKEWVIYTTKPGWLIGKAGVTLRKYEKILNNEFYCNYKVKIVEIRGEIVNYERR